MAFITEPILGDRRIQLGFEDFARPMVIGTNWTKIRIGMRLSIWDSFSTMPAAFFWIGVTQGTTYTYTSPNCIDAVGMTFNNPGNTWTRSAGPPAYYTNSTNGTILRKVGLTTTQQTQSGSFNHGISAVPTAYRTAFYCDLTKGAGTFSGTYWCNGNTITDVSRYSFISGLETETSPLGYNPLTPAALSYTGAYALDSVCIVWGKSVPTVEISDLTIIRFN